jgi:serine O-acetyltransferase
MSELAGVVDELCREAQGLGFPEGGRVELPSRADVHDAIAQIRAAFFPGYFGATDLSDRSLHWFIGSAVTLALREIEEQIRRALAFSSRSEPAADARSRAAAVCATFLARLPAVRRLVATDVEAAYAGDPALRSRDEAIFSYPGLHAVVNQRLAHELFLLEVPLLPRMITEDAHSATGIDIHPGASIGESFFIDHGTSVVIGETARIGDRVRLYQGVTLGAKSFPLDSAGRPVKGVDRHPIVEDDVVIYAGATILGRVTIGRGSIIGGNVWLTRSVAPGSRITQVAPESSSFEQGAGI